MANTLVIASGNAQLLAQRHELIGPAGEISFGPIEWIRATRRNATGIVCDFMMRIDQNSRIAQCVKVILGYNDFESNQQCADPLKLQNAQTGLINELIENGEYRELKIANI